MSRPYWRVAECAAKERDLKTVLGGSAVPKYEWPKNRKIHSRLSVTAAEWREEKVRALLVPFYFTNILSSNPRTGAAPPRPFDALSEDGHQSTWAYRRPLYRVVIGRNHSPGEGMQAEPQNVGKGPIFAATKPSLIRTLPFSCVTRSVAIGRDGGEAYHCLR